VSWNFQTWLGHTNRSCKQLHLVENLLEKNVKTSSLKQQIRRYYICIHTPTLIVHVPLIAFNWQVLEKCICFKKSYMVSDNDMQGFVWSFQQRDLYILSIGTKNKSWWLENGIGCTITNTSWKHEGTIIADSSRSIPPEDVISGCLLDYYYVEVIHAGVQCLLAVSINNLDKKPNFCRS